MRDRLFSRLARALAAHPGLFLAGALALTALAGLAARSLRMETRILDLVPGDDPAALEYNAIIKRYSSASQIMVGIEGGDEADKIAFADALDERAREAVYRDADGEARPYVQRTIVRADLDFLERHGLMLTKVRDLESLDALFTDLELAPLLAAYNDYLEREYIEDTASVTEREKEDRAIDGLKSTLRWLEGIERVDAGDDALAAEADQVALRMSVGNPYLLSHDGSMLLALVTPAISVDRMEETIEGVRSLREVIRDIQRDFPELEVRMAGMPVLALEEMEVGFEDMGVSSAVSLLIVLALFVLAFRLWSAPLLAVTTLVVGIVWTSGFIALTVGRLNLFTLMFAVILIGLGIDFSIHLTAAYTTARGRGAGLADALAEMFRRAGGGVLTGAITTAAAFLALALTGLDAFVELGVVLAAGIALTMVASFTVLPALLAVHERVGARIRGGRPRPARAGRLALPWLGAVGEGVRRRPWPVVIVTALLAAGAVYVARGAEFEPDMLEIEPPDMPSVTLHRDILERFELHPDYTLFTTDDLEKTRAAVRRLKRNRLVGRVEAITELVPSAEQQRRRAIAIEPIRERMARFLEPRVVGGLPHGSALGELPEYLARDAVPAGDVDTLLAELDRLQMNVQEIGQLAFASMKNRLARTCTEIAGGEDERLSRVLALKRRLAAREDLARAMARWEQMYVPRLAERIERMADTSRVTVDTLPDHIAERYLSDDGRNLVTVYAAVDVWQYDKMDLFLAATSKVAERATGSVVLIDRLIELVGREGLLATFLAFGTVLLVLLVDFRSVRWALVGALPLLVGFAGMLGLFVAAGRKFDVANVVAIPLILGIGIDDAVHMIHALEREGVRATSAVLRHTGRALVLTSLTTAIAFGSIAFASHRGLAGMGQLLVIGVGTCLLASLVFLPALARIFFGRGQSNAEKGGSQ